MKNIYLFIISSLVSMTIFSQEPVTYQNVSDEINSKIYDLIKSELFNPKYDTFKSKLYCGPNLWKRYSSIENISKIEKGDIEFLIPNGSEQLKEKGKLIQKRDDFKIIWNQVIKDFDNTRVNIRKLNLQEIDYYWSIIFFDIEEPIFLIENENHKIIVDFFKDGKIFFIEEVI